MPTLQDLQQKLYYLANDSNIGNNTTLDLFNECSDDISDIAGYEQTFNANFTANQATIDNMPSDVMEVVDFRVKRNSDLSYLQMGDLQDFQYTWFGNQLEFATPPTEDGVMQMRYFARLPRFTDLSETPVIEERFHRIYPIFAVVRYIQNYFQTEINLKNDFLAEYLKTKAELQANTIKKRSRYVPSVFQVKVRW